MLGDMIFALELSSGVGENSIAIHVAHDCEERARRRIFRVVFGEAVVAVQIRMF